ncbi:MAG: hypothetical protein GX589_11355 [Deltaproteobacteria bacterium]|nr:hypothetical protein [Deltaproteobacteria bacterium]
MDLRPKKEIAGDQSIFPPTAKAMAAFTLIEVTIALLVLASSLVVLLGLQTSSVQRSLRDRAQQEAMLAARSILSAIEINSTDLEAQDTTDSAAELLRKLTKAHSAPQTELLPDKYQANLRVEDLEIPVPNTDPKFAENMIGLKQVLLTIFWGERPDQELRVVFLVPSEIKKSHDQRRP